MNVQKTFSAKEAKMKKNIAHWVLILTLLAGLSAIGTAAEIETLTLSRAIEIALKDNPDLKQVSNQTRLSQITVKQKKANFLPEVSISANSSQQYGKGLDTQTGRYENEDSRNLSINLSSAINLFNGFYDKASLQQSKFELKAAEENFSRSGQTIIFETLQRYIQAVTAKELIEVEKENLKAQEIQLARIQDFYKAGRRPIADLYQQKAEIAGSQYQLLNSERNYEVNKLNLLQTLGLKPGKYYQVSDPGIDKLLKDIETYNKENALKEALAKRPDLNAQRMQIQAGEKAITVSRSGYWPRLSLFADLGTDYNSLNQYSGFSDQLFDNNLNAAVGLSLTIPLFDKGATKNSVAAAKINLENHQLELEKMENQVLTEVQQAMADYRIAKEQLKVTEAQVKYSQAALESIEARYNVNAAALVELTQARAQYLESQYARVEAKYNLLLRGTAVIFYTGDGNAMLAVINKK